MKLSNQTKRNVFYTVSGLTVVFLFATVLIVGIYQLGWNNQVTEVFLEIIPLPAAVVEGKLITISTVNDRLRAFQRAVSYQTEYEFNTGTGQETLAQQRSQILESLIEARLIESLAGERGISVDQTELESYFTYLLPQFGILEEDAPRQIREIFGWSEEEFQSKIVKPDLLRAKLLIALLSESKESEARAEIEQVQRDALRGFSFTTLAKQHSDDEQSKFLGGELGFFIKQDLPPWFKDNAFELAEGEFSDIIVSPNGYHIFQALFRDEQIDPVQVQLRHILVADDPLSEILEQKRSLTKVYVRR